MRAREMEREAIIKNNLRFNMQKRERKKNTEAAINTSETEPFVLLWSTARKL